MWALFICSFVADACHGQMQTILRHAEIVRNESLSKQLERFLVATSVEIKYDHIVLVKDAAERKACIFENLIHHVNKPVIVTSQLIDTNWEQAKHSSNFLLVTCSLKYLRQTNIVNSRYQYVPHVIWVDEEVKKPHEFLVCAAMAKFGLLQNLIVTPASLFGQTDYLSCDLKRNLKPIKFKSFAKPSLDLRGLSITTESDQLPPRSILYYNAKGQLRLTGFVANYLKTFAGRYGARLVIKQPAEMGVTVHYDYLANRTFEGILDIAAAAAPYKLDTTTASYSYPVELMEYCFMIPLPHVRPANNVFFDIIEARAMLIILIYFVAFGVFLNVGRYLNLRRLNFAQAFCEDKSFRGLLGQSFVMPRKTSLFMKYILFLLCYSSILLCTSYQAYLQSHLVHPSLEKRMETFEDIRQNKFKIIIDDRESRFMHRETLERHRDLFVQEDSFDRFLKRRDSMDIRYIFPVSLTRWSVFRERQTLFQRKLFYYSSQLCLNNLVLLSFPLRPGLPYKMHFNQHLLDVRETGLLDCWLNRNFLVMVRLKLSSFQDLSVADAYGPQLDVNDFLWIWVSYAACTLVSVSVFVAELLSNQLKH